MKLLHVTNIVSPHQMPLARCLVAQLGTENYRYAATAVAPRERMGMGWDCGDQDSWVVRVNESEGGRQECLRWWQEADVVVCGDRALRLMEQRLEKGRLTLYMSERWWKPPLGKVRLVHPRFLLMALQLRRLAASERFHYLPIGRYAAADMNWWGGLRNRSWMWGYFTAMPKDLPQVRQRKGGLDVLFAGRMLGWKRIDTLVRAFGVLWRSNASARLTLVGDGPERRGLEVLVKRLGLAGPVVFEPSLPMGEVWQRMRSSHIFVLASNGQEGWGAVVNEAMTQGCAVVASSAAGSAKTMIRHGENGLLFPAGDWRQLGRLLGQLETDESLRLRLAQVGQERIAEYWSPKVAAQRLLVVCDALLSNEVVPAFGAGPMSQVRR